MNTFDAAAQYRQLGSTGAHPVGLVVRLYDALLEDFRRAAEAAAARDIEQRTAALNHALLILAELESTLDHERGGKVAKHLKGLYRIARSLTVEANLHSSVARIERLTALFLPVRKAWTQAEQELCRQNSGNANVPEQKTMTAEIGEPVTAGARSWSV